MVAPGSSPYSRLPCSCTTSFHPLRQFQRLTKRKSPCFVLFLAHNTDDTPLTSALLKISFDGRRFTGWSSSNDPKPGDPNYRAFSKKERRRSRSRRGSMDPPIKTYDKGFVRSVQGVLRGHLAKIYGNLDPQQIVVEGCSRTDKGVHARSMMAQIYGIDAMSMSELGKNTANANSTLVADDSIASTMSGMHRPHPRSSTDASSFLPIPKDLSNMAFALNRMLPPDIRMAGIAPVPDIDKVEKLDSVTTTTTRTRTRTRTTRQDILDDVFHPSLSTVTKTYVYTFSIGNSNDVPDPTARRWVWHIPATNSQCQDQPALDMDKVQEACSILQGTHDFSSFQGAARGATDRLKREQAVEDSGVCTLYSIVVKELPKEDLVPSEPPPTSTQYQVEVVGDRFLYKMVRFLVGALIDIGLSKNDSMGLEALAKALQESDQERVFTTCAAAHGLVLHSVDYGVDIDWQPLRN